MAIRPPNHQPHQPQQPDRVLLYGSPGSGKTTHAQRLEAQGYDRLEREDFHTMQQFRVAVAYSHSDRLAVVRCCFTPEELDEWAALTQATRTQLFDPGRHECKRRVKARARHNWRGEMSGVDRWYQSMGQAASIA